MDTADVVIAGAGIIGLTLALDLAAHGLRVIVLDRARAMTESSWAAAGMLAANDPENPPELSGLAQYSLKHYPSFLTQLEHLSSRNVPVRTSTTIQASHSGENFPTEQSSGQKLTHGELARLVPQLNPGSHDFLLLAEQSLDPRDLCAALPLAARAIGVTLLEDSPVLSVETTETSITIQTPTGSITAAHFVNAAGAWAESPSLGLAPIAARRIHPRKGQMATLRLRGGETLTHVLRTPEIYLVPRGDQRIVIGATVEHSGYDKTVEPRAIARLLQTAAELFPPIAHAEILDTWAGLRPGSADSLPLIGQTAPNLWIAAGHFRNGILLAPGSARLLSQLTRGETPDIDLTPFNPRRTFPSPPA